MVLLSPNFAKSIQNVSAILKYYFWKRGTLLWNDSRKKIIKSNFKMYEEHLID